MEASSAVASVVPNTAQCIISPGSHLNLGYVAEFRFMFGSDSISKISCHMVRPGTEL